MSTDTPDTLEEKVRDGMVRQLRKNLARCRRVIIDEKIDLKTREPWTLPYNNTSRVLSQILKDRQMRDCEKRLREIEEYEENEKNSGRPETTRSEAIDRDEDSPKDRTQAAARTDLDKRLYQTSSSL